MMLHACGQLLSLRCVVEFVVSIPCRYTEGFRYRSPVSPSFVRGINTVGYVDTARRAAMDL
jgi:hypothetical protein